MKHYILSDDIRNLLMQTILKEEDAKEYAKKLAAGDPNDKSEEGKGGDAEEYLKIRKQKEQEAAAKAAAETSSSGSDDDGEHTTDPKIMAARRAKIAKLAQGAVGKDDPTSHMYGRYRNPHTDKKARAEAEKANQGFKDREAAFRAKDAEREKNRAAALAAKKAETEKRAQATAAATTKPKTKPTTAAVTKPTKKTTKKPASRKK
jgi:hypothetical protein